MERDIDEIQAEKVLNYLIKELGEKEICDRVTESMQDTTRDEADGFDSVNGWYPSMCEEDDGLSEDEIDELFDDHVSDIFGDSRIDYSDVYSEFWSELEEFGEEYCSSTLSNLLVHFREGIR